MPYEFYSNSLKTWKAMHEAIENARKSIYLEMYIFRNDIEGYDFLGLLEKKSKEGLCVRIVLDFFGSATFSKEDTERLQNAGAEILFFKKVLHRIHRKILIIDEEMAFIGGVNFHQVARKWEDLAVKITGRLMPSIIRSFAKMYRSCGGEDPILLSKMKKMPTPKSRTWLIEHFPAWHNLGLKRVYKENMRKAEKSVVLVTPYFMPKRWFIRLLRQAVDRGVEVEVLVPKEGNHFLPDRVNYFFMYKLSQRGIKFYLRPKMNHAKAMIIDGKEAVLGTHNLDFLSFELNDEVGIFFKEPASVERLNEIITKWKDGADLFKPELFKPKLFDYLISPIVRMFLAIF